MPKRKIIQLGFLLLLSIIALRLFLVPFGSRPSDGEPFKVRVRLVQDAKSLKFGPAGSYRVNDAETQGLLAGRITLDKPAEVSPSGSGIKFGGMTFAVRRIKVSPLGSGSFALNGVTYRGAADIIRTKKGGLSVVNTVGLEDYLKGVLPREINPFWPREAMEAQAIASRSFAVHENMRRRDRKYDLTDDTFSQVYGGKSSERRRTTRAVEATKDKILIYKGEALPAYFHSSCGGYTRDVSSLWGNGPAPLSEGEAGLRPLRGRRCPWCRWFPHFRWQARISTRIILDKLNAGGYPLESIDDIRTGGRDDSKRLKRVRIRSRNKWFEIPVEDFRCALDKRTLKSANFHVKKYPRFYLFSGHGWGHGVGMCQWGAFGMSLRGRRAEEILQYYYPGAEIADMRQMRI